MARKRSDHATVGDLEDFADSLREVLGPLGGLLGGDDDDDRRSPKAPTKKTKAEPDDDEDEGPGPLSTVAKGWFGGRA